MHLVRVVVYHLVRTIFPRAAAKRNETKRMPATHFPDRRAADWVSESRCVGLSRVRRVGETEKPTIPFVPRAVPHYRFLPPRCSMLGCLSRASNWNISHAQNVLFILPATTRHGVNPRWNTMRFHDPSIEWTEKRFRWGGAGVVRAAGWNVFGFLADKARRQKRRRNIGADG